jgi:hypothetical protein
LGCTRNAAPRLITPKPIVTTVRIGCPKLHVGHSLLITGVPPLDGWTGSADVLPPRDRLGCFPLHPVFRPLILIVSVLTIGR